MPQYILLDSISSLPEASAPDDAERVWRELSEQAALPSAFLTHPNARPLCNALTGNAPFLARLLERQWSFFLALCEHGSQTTFARELEQLAQTDIASATPQDTMRTLRQAKQRAALLIATADIANLWSVDEVVRHLSLFADAAINLATNFLLYQAHQKGELALPNPTQPQQGSHLLILGMGKLGAYELNYSSDIDLIILFDKEYAPYRGRHNAQHFFTQFAQQLCSLMQDRTSDGYVFRTDLRLRPDPLSTPLAVNLYSAITYYETLGQNWERAAMIKARQIAGDSETGAIFQQHITPYIWRKHLDFAAIADIHSIKRQMSIKAGQPTSIGGYNVKLGRGGIREIEFFVQTQQLVWGGRFPELREKPTLVLLQKLVSLDLLTQAKADTLTHAYRFLRRVEHYLQMIDDQQTHSLPEQDSALSRVAIFLGYSSVESLAVDIAHHSNAVHQLYSESMDDTPPLAIEGNLVFTGVDADPETLTTLSNMGYSRAADISSTIQSWHRGKRRATKTIQARQILTELIPSILVAFADTASPDQTFFRFDTFLAKLPSGVQIFSLLSARKELLELLAEILGNAPALGEILSKHPLLLDAVVQGDFYEALPSRSELIEELKDKLHHARDYDDAQHILRIYKNERQFQAGVHLLEGLGDPTRIGEFLSDLAEAIIDHLVTLAQNEFAQKYGYIPGTSIALLAQGKLGSRELTFHSDLDITIIYQSLPQSPAYSDGEKSIDVRTYYNRLSARIINAFTLMTKEGRLYEVDTRLRPAGSNSLMAIQRSAFDLYFYRDAWIFELMALTKTRVVFSSDNGLCAQLNHILQSHLIKEYEPHELVGEVFRMRQKITASHPGASPWNIKYTRGGLIDLDFLAQYLLLRYAHQHPELICNRTTGILKAAQSLSLMPPHLADQLIEAYHFLSAILSFQRLCAHQSGVPQETPDTLKKLLCRHLNIVDPIALKSRLLETEDLVHKQFSRLDEL